MLSETDIQGFRPMNHFSRCAWLIGSTGTHGTRSASATIAPCMASAMSAVHPRISVMTFSTESVGSINTDTCQRHKPPANFLAAHFPNAA